jgi:hypothetical protein
VRRSSHHVPAPVHPRVQLQRSASAARPPPELRQRPAEPSVDQPLYPVLLVAPPVAPRLSLRNRRQLALHHRQLAKLPATARRMALEVTVVPWRVLCWNAETPVLPKENLMPTQIVMDATGDTRYQFEANDQAALVEAEKRFGRGSAGLSCDECPRPGRLPRSRRDLSAMPLIGNRVRFHEAYRPPQVRWGAIGILIDMEERPGPYGQPHSRRGTSRGNWSW